MKRVARTWAARLCATAIVFSFAAIAQAAHPQTLDPDPARRHVCGHGEQSRRHRRHARVNMPPGSFPPFANHSDRLGARRDARRRRHRSARSGSGLQRGGRVNDRGTFVLATSPTAWRR
jgi:hypothetical protein